MLVSISVTLFGAYWNSELSFYKVFVIQNTNVHFGDQILLPHFQERILTFSFILVCERIRKCFHLVKLLIGGTKNGAGHVAFCTKCVERKHGVEAGVVRGTGGMEMQRPKGDGFPVLEDGHNAHIKSVVLHRQSI